MTSPIYYRREAERCRRLAHSSKGTEAERRWFGLANDYECLAKELDRQPRVACAAAPSIPPKSPPSWRCGNDY